jgi:hypothetical protein
VVAMCSASTSPLRLSATAKTSPGRSSVTARWGRTWAEYPKGSGGPAGENPCP